MSVTYRWGRAIGRYSLRTVRAERFEVDGLERMPEGPAILVSWHGNNMVALAAHRTMRQRPYLAFVPPGATGATMAGWLDGAGCIEAVPLPQDGTGNPSGALKRMARGLKAGHDVVIALDGPSGPARRARPGATWLARLSRVPLVPVGFAARPAVRYPRWDRHLVPLPGARVFSAVGEPIHVDRSTEVDDDRVAVLTEALDAVQRRADEMRGAG